MITEVWDPCAPLLLCTVDSDHPGMEPIYYYHITVHCEEMMTQVWNPRLPLLMCIVGSYHPGVEPLCPFTTVHYGQ